MPDDDSTKSITPDEDSNDSTDSNIKVIICEDVLTGKASEETHINLNILKNSLKNLYFRRFCLCEFFYSPVDYQIFLQDNEFMCLVKENLPNLKLKKLRLCEWRQIRRLIGKPRRLSKNFLSEERIALEAKRSKIKDLYKGNLTQLDPDSIDLPTKLPRQLMVGTKVFAKINGSKDSVLNAIVDAVQEDGYRVVFEKDRHPSIVVKEYDIMCAQPPELLSISYFLSTNKANQKTQIPQPSTFTPVLVDRIQQQPVISGYSTDANGSTSNSGFHQIKGNNAKNDIVGNFPVRMLVIIVKMCKLLDHKRNTLRQFKTLNDEAMKMQRYGHNYPDKFLKVIAEVIIELEAINKMLRVYAEALNPYRQSLLNQRSRVIVTERPEVLRKTCNNHANQISKYCSTVVDVKNQGTKDLIAMLTSLILQIRFLGQHAVSSRSCAEEVQILSDSIKELKEMIPKESLPAFESGVEIHMKQIYNVLLKVRPTTSNNPPSS